MRNKIVLIFMSLWAAVFLVACGQSDAPEGTGGKGDAPTEEMNEDEEKNEGGKEASNDFNESNESNEADTQNTTDSTNDTKDDQQGELTVHFIDVGQADATLIEFKGEEEEYRILYDAGNWDRNDVIQYLQTQQIDYIDILIGSHIHADHIGQMDKVIGAVDVGEVWMTGEVGTSKTFERILQAIEMNDLDYHEPRAGEVYDIGPIVLEILHPTQLGKDPNNNSISMKLTFRNVSFVMTGDAEKISEESMLQQGFDLKADILSLGHHGSSTSTSESFLKEVDPDVAIYSAGQGNSYGHPHREVVSLVKNSGIELYGTDVHGTIIVKTDGKDYSILTKKEGTISPKPTSTAKQSNQTNQSNQSNQTDEKEKVENNEKANPDQTQEKESPSKPSSSNCIDINSASMEELQAIIHIGPERAQQIVQLRPFSSVDALTRVKGIGPARIADIKKENKACVVN